MPGDTETAGAVVGVVTIAAGAAVCVVTIAAGAADTCGATTTGGLLVTGVLV